ncbi:hypothetical protein SteCoe_35222 [Stentor coeruleus]|uniref:Uncharacterized protein n=1 Tax=Stentor coeruleus TaxID=5963 RepID=A0A1R2ASS7_9CILI|nr:hypothetical protein SteCoe_35222 [Stentor coeruleus]
MDSKPQLRLDSPLEVEVVVISESNNHIPCDSPDATTNSEYTSSPSFSPPVTEPSTASNFQILKDSLENWSNFCKLCLYGYIIIIIFYQIYWGTTIAQPIENSNRRVPNQYLFLIRIFLFFLVLLGAYFCHQAILHKDTESILYALEYIVTITMVLCVFITFVTYRKIKIRKSIYKLMKQRGLEYCDLDYDSECDRKISEDGFYEDFDEDGSGYDYDDVLREDEHLDIKRFIMEGVIAMSMVLVLQSFVIFMMIKLYRYAKAFEQFSSGQLTVRSN